MILWTNLWEKKKPSNKPRSQSQLLHCATYKGSVNTCTPTANFLEENSSYEQLGYVSSPLNCEQVELWTSSPSGSQKQPSLSLNYQEINQYFLANRGFSYSFLSPFRSG